MSRSSLLSDLKIDREPERRPPAGGGGRLWWILGAAGILALLVGALVWFLVVRPDLARVETATAATWTGAASRGGSLLDASGYVVARREATVSSKITGKVLEVLIEEGQRVRAGQVIARLDDSNVRAAVNEARAQVAAAEASLKVAQTSVESAGPRYQRSQRLHTAGYLSDQDVEDAKATFDTARYTLELDQRQAQVARAALEVARRSEDDTVVRAPFSGVVTVKAAQPGEMVSPISAGGGFTRTGIGTIVDMDSLEVEVDVAESFINRVSQGMPATVKLNAYPEWEIPAEVIAVIPTADRSKATVSVRVGFKTKDPRIVPEMGAHVAFLGPAQTASGPNDRSVIVPPDAVVTEDSGQPVVFVIADGKAERHAVRLGDHGPQGQVVVAGLAPGDVVAVEGADKLKDGVGVRVTKQMTGKS
ncbi:MAG: efflux RND transporter periplasmic adaptor subunit [Caulobacterales bacterium]